MIYLAFCYYLPVLVLKAFLIKVMTEVRGRKVVWADPGKLHGLPSALPGNTMLAVKLCWG
jgi:hypothetical protein